MAELLGFERMLAEDYELELALGVKTRVTSTPNLAMNFAAKMEQMVLLYLPNQIRYPTGGERITKQGVKNEQNSPTL